MSDAVVDVPVLIAGGGPVGVTLAMQLAALGIHSIVLERRSEQSPSPRCNTTNARSMEIFRRLGVADAVRAAGLPSDFNTDVVYMTRMNGSELTRYARPTPDDVRNGTMHGVASDWPTPEPQHFISQLFLEPVLREHARTAYGIDLREGWEFLDFVQDAGGVTARARDTTTGSERTFRAQYLVGADGGGSAVRREIGARLDGIPEIGNACSIYMEAPRLTELYHQTPGWMYRFSAGGVLVAIDGGDRWLLHLNRPPGVPFDAAFDPEPAMFGAIGEPFAYTVLSDVRWTSRAMVANKFREGRVFLAGDAAHIWVPMGGFGMNAGVADGATLGWMLGGVLAGWLDEHVLDAYEAERAPLGGMVASQAARWAIELFALLRSQPLDANALEADAEARARLGDAIRTTNIGEFECPGMQLGFYYASSPIVAYDGTEPPPFTLEAYRETSWPGARAPHVVHEGRPLFDAFGSAFTLLRIGTLPPRGAELIAAAERRGLPLAVVDVPEAEAVRAYEGYGLVLVRPDGHVAWRSLTDPLDAGAILDRVTGVLVPQRRIATFAAQPFAGELAFPNGVRVHGTAIARGDAAGARHHTGRVYTTDGAASVIAIEAGGMKRIVLDNLREPRAVAITPDGNTLLILETAAARVLQARIAPDGALGDVRTFIDLNERACCDLAVDGDGGIWLAFPAGGVEGYDGAGRLTTIVTTAGVAPIACSVDEMTLLIAGTTGGGETGWLGSLQIPARTAPASASAPRVPVAAG